ncbi:fluoride efflux transporter CrcB [Dongia sp.]|uniref:fluoride efflux transporter CrcB n=1 Tax=Dongia sp. TaxID=1977262 RepID=UPI0037501002
MLYAIVFVGAGIGGMLRHGVNMLGPRLAGADFPYATMTINIVGSLAMGLIAGYFAFRGGEGLFGSMSQHWRLFLTTGVLGGFTTFSAFSLDFATLWERGAMGGAAFYLAASVLGSLVAIFAALAAARAIWG